MTEHKDLPPVHWHGSRFTGAAGSPVGVVTPAQVGQVYHDTANGDIYVADGLTNTDWNLVIGSQLVTIPVSFTFATGTPLDFGTLVSGDQILGYTVAIDVVFDDSAALLALGQVSSPGNLLPTNAIDPTVLGTYHGGESLLVAGADSFRLNITPGTSTQGSGRVNVLVRRT